MGLQGMTTEWQGEQEFSSIFSISSFSNVTRDVAKYVQPGPRYLYRDGWLRILHLFYNDIFVNIEIYAGAAEVTLPSRSECTIL